MRASTLVLRTGLSMVVFFLSLACPCRAEDLYVSLKQAVDLAVAQSRNPSVRLYQEKILEARAEAQLARAALLPHFSGTVIEQKRTVNLEAFGLVSAPGFRPPKLVGPFTTFDARASLTHNILDLGAIRRYQAASKGILAAEAQSLDFQDQVAAETAQAYLETVLAESELEAAEADLQLAEELLELAVSRKTAGTGTRIEETRARVQISLARRELVASQNRVGNARLVLLRLMGQSLDSGLQCAQPMALEPMPFEDLNEALDSAWRRRTNLQAQERLVQSLELNYQAGRLDRVPALRGFADYGTIGIGPASSIPTWTAGIAVELPIFDGGAVDARRAQELSRLRQARIQLEDLRRGVELEVRLALGSVRLVEEQLAAAEEGLKLAREELEQARRRYSAGVSTGLEVTEAQTRVKQTQQDRIAALYRHNHVRIRLLKATGTLRIGQ